jgi:predicted Ser/Thr protein kinase
MVCRLFQSLDRHALLMDYVDGAPLRDNAPGQEFYTRLEDLIRRMHAAGVAHCDLRTGSNILVGKDGRPYIIDFASCVFRGRGLNPFINLVFREFRRADLFAALWVKKRFSPMLLTPEDEAALARPLPFERPAIFIGKTIRNLTRRALTRS